MPSTLGNVVTMRLRVQMTEIRLKSFFEALKNLVCFMRFSELHLNWFTKMPLNQDGCGGNLRWAPWSFQLR